MSQLVLGKVFKGLYAGAVAFLTALGTALNGAKGFSDVAPSQWVWIILGTVVAIGGAYGIASWPGPNVGNGKNGTNVSKGS